MYKDGHPSLVMLIGLPGCGKSTWRNNVLDYERFCKGHSDTVVVSSDDIIDRKAISMGKTYSEIFTDVSKDAMQEMNDTSIRAILDGKDVIWDQTNLTRKSRDSKKAYAEDHGYQVSAVFFDVDPQVCWDRCQFRIGKEIPKLVFNSMAKQWAEITVPDLMAEFYNRVMVVRNG